MALDPGFRLGRYEVVVRLGSGGPASVRDPFLTRERRRGLAEARTRTQS
jgi:hypothetical protein